MRTYKPTSPGRRHYEPVDKRDLYQGPPEKSLSKYIKDQAGRDSSGNISVRGRGGRNRRLYRTIDFRREKDGVPATVKRIEYDPNRSANIALLHYHDGEKRYILSPRKLEVGDVVESGPDAPVRVGNCKSLESIPLGAFVHNVELRPGAGGQFCRGAGTSGQVAGKDNDRALIRLPSGQARWVRQECRATIGQVGNIEHFNQELGKAGQSRYRGRRPITRGMARNPVDHPHGGGEGRHKGGHPSNPTGRRTLGEKTRNNKRTDRFVVREIRE